MENSYSYSEPEEIVMRPNEYKPRYIEKKHFNKFINYSRNIEFLNYEHFLLYHYYPKVDIVVFRNKLFTISFRTSNELVAGKCITNFIVKKNNNNKTYLKIRYNYDNKMKRKEIHQNLLKLLDHIIFNFISPDKSYFKRLDKKLYKSITTEIVYNKVHYRCPFFKNRIMVEKKHVFDNKDNHILKQAIFSRNFLDFINFLFN